MAFPLLLASLFLQGASIAANNAAANKVAAGRTAAQSAERDRQRKLDIEANAANERSRNRYKDVEAQRAAKAVQLGDFLAKAQPTAPAAGGSPDANAMAGSVMPTATNDVVTREIAKKADQASAFTGQQARALGGLRSFGDLLGDIGTQQARDAGQVGQINSFKQGSANMLPLELDAANQRGGGLRLLGDILGGVGGIGTTAALTGGGVKLPGQLFGGNSWGATPKVYG